MSVKIVETSKAITRAEEYNLTLAPSIQKMADQESQVIEVAVWCLYEDEDKEGKTQALLSIMTPEGEVFATNSPTFKEDFNNMLDFFGDEGVHSIKVISGTSKAGRTFITCSYES